MIILKIVLNSNIDQSLKDRINGSKNGLLSKSIGIGILLKFVKFKNNYIIGNIKLISINDCINP